jgi:hypothetical protein
MKMEKTNENYKNYDYNPQTYEIEQAIERLNNLGISPSDLHQDYYKIPLENIDLTKIEKELPKKSKVVTKHNIIIDSRQRDYSIYEKPNNYLVNLSESHRNVERIELIAAMMPKTEYNINSDNNLLIVTINGLTEPLLLIPGQYLIGSNVVGNVNYIANGSTVINGLLAEVQRTLNTHTNSSNNFNVFLATTPSLHGGTGINSSVLNRIVITNSSVSFTIDFTNANYSSGSPFRVLGFNKKVYDSNNSNVIYSTDNLGTCTQTDLNNFTTNTISIQSIVSVFDYNLKDDPHYLIMELEFGNKTAERIESIDIATNQKFAVIIYDANEPDNIQSYNSTNTLGGNVQINVSRPPGRLKALKGSDFDKKIVIFNPPITLENFKISFYKYDNTYYNFNNREHMLAFEIDVVDYNPNYRY